MSKITAVIASEAHATPPATKPLAGKRDDNSKPEVDIEALQKELQDKRKLLNLLEEKGVPHNIDVKAIDKALADLDAIIESKGRA